MYGQYGSDMLACLNKNSSFSSMSHINTYQLNQELGNNKRRTTLTLLLQGQIATVASVLKVLASSI